MSRFRRCCSAHAPAERGDGGERQLEQEDEGDEPHKLRVLLGYVGVGVGVGVVLEDEGDAPHELRVRQRDGRVVRVRVGVRG